ncbi:MAG: FtsX-like permease family protein, partial [Luteitalea sp.]
RGDILRHFLIENWIVTTLGIALGIGLSVALNLTLLSQVDGARMTPQLLAVGALLLCAAVLLATLWPAMRGARVTPSEATRNI